MRSILCRISSVEASRESKILPPQLSPILIIYTHTYTGEKKKSLTFEEKPFYCADCNIHIIDVKSDRFTWIFPSYTRCPGTHGQSIKLVHLHHI